VLAWCVPAAARHAVAEGLRRARPLWCVAGAALGVVTFSVACALVYGFNHFFELEEYSYSDHLFDAGWGWGMSILVVAVQPAVFEELAFRGVVFSALRRVLESGEAVLVSALMFMILHLSVLSFPHLLLIGVVLGWLRVRTGSLLPGMFLHFTHNLLCVAWERYWAA
jgi:membrane protease YdiL (CAAX protease family)